MKKSVFIFKLVNMLHVFVFFLCNMAIMLMPFCFSSCTDLKRRNFDNIEKKFIKINTPNDTSDIHIFEKINKNYFFRKDVKKQGWGKITGFFRRYLIQDNDGAFSLRILFEVHSNDTDDVETYEIRYAWTIPSEKERNLQGCTVILVTENNGKKKIPVSYFSSSITNIVLKRKVGSKFYYNIGLIHSHNKTKIKEDIDIVIHSVF